MRTSAHDLSAPTGGCQANPRLKKKDAGVGLAAPSGSSHEGLELISMSGTTNRAGDQHRRIVGRARELDMFREAFDRMLGGSTSAGVDIRRTWNRQDALRRGTRGGRGGSGRARAVGALPGGGRRAALLAVGTDSSRLCRCRVARRGASQHGHGGEGYRRTGSRTARFSAPQPSRRPAGSRIRARRDFAPSTPSASSSIRRRSRCPLPWCWTTCTGPTRRPCRCWSS